jgi:hypothetical protein
MELAILLVLLVLLAVAYKLGLFELIKELTEEATLKRKAYIEEHKIKTYKRYENMDTDFDVDAINEKIRKIDSLKFD